MLNSGSTKTGPSRPRCVPGSTAICSAVVQLKRAQPAQRRPQVSWNMQWVRKTYVFVKSLWFRVYTFSLFTISTFSVVCPSIGWNRHTFLCNLHIDSWSILCFCQLFGSPFVAFSSRMFFVLFVELSTRFLSVHLLFSSSVTLHRFLRTCFQQGSTSDYRRIPLFSPPSMNTTIVNMCRCSFLVCILNLTY